MWEHWDHEASLTDILRVHEVRHCCGSLLTLVEVSFDSDEVRRAQGSSRVALGQVYGLAFSI
jgi:hypothetical protein